MNVSDQVAQIIAARNVQTVFSLAGEAHMRIIKAIEDAGISVIGTRTENGTIGAADGYARVAGVPGVALVNTSQGLPNGVPAVLTAMEAASPLVVLAAMPPPAAGTTPAAVSNAASGSVTGTCKAVLTVNDPAAVFSTLQEAFDLALAGRPGPVVVKITTDMLGDQAVSPAGQAEAAADTPSRVQTRLSGGASDADLAAAVQLLSGCRKVIAVVGQEARWSADLDGIRALCSEHEIVALGDGLGRGLIPEGTEQGYSIKLAIDLCADADAVILLGGEATTSTGLGNPRFFADSAKVIRITATADSPFQMSVPDLTLIGDVGAVSRALSGELAAAGHRPDPEFKQRIAVAVTDRLATLDAAVAAGAAPLCPGQLPTVVRDLAPDNAIQIADGAVINGWSQALLQVSEFPGWMDHAPLGSMGMGTPLAIGAAAAARDQARRDGTTPRRVIVVSGDGAAGYFLSEWGVARQYGLPIIVLVSNDSGWGTERLKQIEVLGRPYNTDFHDVRYDVIAQGLGCEGVRVDTAEQLATAFGAALASDGPSVIDVLTDGVGPRPVVPRFFPGGRHGENRA